MTYMTVHYTGWPRKHYPSLSQVAEILLIMTQIGLPPGIPTGRNPHWTESPLDGIPTRISYISGYSGQWGFRAPRYGIPTKFLFMLI